MFKLNLLELKVQLFTQKSQVSSDSIQVCLAELNSENINTLYTKIRNSSKEYEGCGSPVTKYYKYKWGLFAYKPVRCQSGQNSEYGMASSSLNYNLRSNNADIKNKTEQAVFDVLKVMEKLELNVRKGNIDAKDIKAYSGEKLYLLYISISQKSYYHFKNHPGSLLFRGNEEHYKRLNRLFKKIYKVPSFEKVKTYKKHIKDYKDPFETHNK